MRRQCSFGWILLAVSLCLFEEAVSTAVLVQMLQPAIHLFSQTTVNKRDTRKGKYFYQLLELF
jgi:hypothetical protein